MAPIGLSRIMTGYRRDSTPAHSRQPKILILLQSAVHVHVFLLLLFPMAAEQQLEPTSPFVAGHHQPRRGRWKTRLGAYIEHLSTVPLV